MTPKMKIREVVTKVKSAIVNTIPDGPCNRFILEHPDGSVQTIYFEEPKNKQDVVSYLKFYNINPIQIVPAYSKNKIASDLLPNNKPPTAKKSS